MDTSRKSGRSFRAAFAMLAATVTVASAGWLVMAASHAATSEKANLSAAEVERGFTLKEWLLIAK